MSRPAHVVAGTWSPDHNPYIDGLINDTNHWQSTTVGGAPQNISVYFSNEDRTWTAAEKASFTSALSSWGAVANIDFDVVTNRADANLIEVKYYDAAPGADLGAHELPAIGSATATGWFNSAAGSYTAAGSLNAGGDAYYTFVHELGHALGLDHPQDGRLFPGVALHADYADLGDNDLNQGVFSVMSYNATYNNFPDVGADFAWGRPMGPMAFDIAAIQQLYGANTDTARGDNTYALPDANAAGTGWNCIWDNAGVDQVVYNGSRDATLDLRAATLRDEPGGGGFLSHAEGIAGGFTIAHGVAIENATGGHGDDLIIGNDAANTLSGREGADILRGGGGADRLDGGNGEDWAVYSDSDVGILVNLATGRGFNGTADRDVLVGIENLEGSGFGDILIGNDQTNRLEGGLGGDYLDGGAGEDWAIYRFSGAGVRVDLATGHGSGGTAEGDTLVGIEDIQGSRFGDTLVGNDQANRLKGGLGADALDGGGGIDWAVYDDSTVGVQLNLVTGRGVGGTAAGDTLHAIENVAGSEHGDILTGNVVANNLKGGGGDDRLDGGGGADILTGGLGNDWFYVDNGGDVIIEISGSGTLDRVFASADYTLTRGAYVEVMSTTDNFGTDPIHLTGNELVNTIYGNAGANVLDGAAGADTLIGWGGDDWYYVDNAGDVVREAAGAAKGTLDRVFASADYTLTDGAYVERMSTTDHTGTAAIRLTGNGLANDIYGNAGDNVLNGGAGLDTLTGWGGSDTFLFNSALGSGNVDHIDFALADHDKIGLDHRIFAVTPETVMDHIVYDSASGNLSYDADGPGGAGSVLFAVLDTHPATLASTDFLIV